MNKESLPDREILRKIVVEVGETVEKKGTRTVTDNSQPNVNVVRRPGEGSRPLFDRDEITNGRRIFGDIEQDRRFAGRSYSQQSNTGDPLRTDYRRDYHSGVSERISYESDNILYRRMRGICPTCYSNTDYFRESGDGRQRRIYRTLSEEGLYRDQSNGYYNFVPTEMETFYLYPHYYAVLETLPSHSMHDCGYYDSHSFFRCTE